ncbi:YtxH domain-containing protein [Sporosarcina sp. E16_8]|uniref:YtxH domain-containing protein n=1 Tax=Sporosarcina sp. E16_8 TaxID=2789295 RepID=UPI001A90FAC0|nr:YtxH domain-containing protein [Sporosarcina sp. E16_8]MBO0587925.1 YtxH domain-containing protein [Sporosarcina sp. E16_8]
MGNSKFGTFIIVGALTGAVVSMFDRSTRKHIVKKSNNCITGMKFYMKNPDVLKWKLEEKKDKYRSVYVQLSGDISYIKAQVEELKTLTPQVKGIVVDTKEAFVESKDEYKSIVNETP